MKIVVTQKLRSDVLVVEGSCTVMMCMDAWIVLQHLSTSNVLSRITNKLIHDLNKHSKEFQTSTVNAKDAVQFVVGMLMFLSIIVISVMLHLVIIMVDAAMGGGQELQPHQFATMETVVVIIKETQHQNLKGQ